MHDLVVLVLIGAAITAVAGLARHYGLLAPIMLVLAGVGLSFIPGFPEIELEPDLVLVAILPPLIYAAAFTASAPTFRTLLRPILSLAVGLVLFTMAAVAVVLHVVVPSVPLAACAAFGAIVSPPDAVAATAIGRRIGLPRRVVTLLEGESLLNDATALTTLRLAVVVAGGAAFTWAGAAIDLLWAGLGGAALGFVLAKVVSWLHASTRDAVIDNSLSLLVPYAVFLIAEEVGVSGVVSVAIVGLVVGHKYPQLATARARIQGQGFWALLLFLLEGGLFLIVGLQVRSILAELSFATREVAAASLAVVLTVVVARFAWVFIPLGIMRLLVHFGWRSNDRPHVTVAAATVVSWAGMRGAVSLAAALTLPSDFPARDLLVWLTVVVIFATLIGQGVTLPWVARRMQLQSDDATADRLAEARVWHAATAVGVETLAELAPTLPASVVARLEGDNRAQSNAVWEQLGDQQRETPAAAYRRGRLAVLAEQREVFIDARDAGHIPEDVMVRVLRDLDLEQSLLDDD